jgi:hypothetical protein
MNKKKVIFSISLFILLALVSTIYSQQNPSCPSPTYGNVGAACESGFNSLRRCKNFLSCVSGTCQPGWLGSSCKANSDCFLAGRLSEDVRCVENKCARLRYNGEACPNNNGNYCFSGICSNGQCGAGNKGVGSTCDSNDYVQCNKGLFCQNFNNNNTCVPQRTATQICAANFPAPYEGPGSNMNIACPGGYRCISALDGSYVCRKVNYLSQGDECIMDWECGANMQCRTTATNPILTCQYPAGTRACGSTTNCQVFNGYSCVCDQRNVTTCMKTSVDWLNQCDYQQQWMNYRNCWAQNNCPYDSNMGYFSLFIDAFPGAGSCMSERCGGIARSLLCCMTQGYDDNVYSPLLTAPFGCGPSFLLPLAIGFLVVVVVIVVTVSVAVGLGLWYKYGHKISIGGNKVEPFSRLE